jgi:hypothetical protein
MGSATGLPWFFLSSEGKIDFSLDAMSAEIVDFSKSLVNLKVV